MLKQVLFGRFLFSGDHVEDQIAERNSPQHAWLTNFVSFCPAANCDKIVVFVKTNRIQKNYVPKNSLAAIIACHSEI